MGLVGLAQRLISPYRRLTHDAARRDPEETMKKLISALAIASLFAGFAAVEEADAGHKYKYKYKYQYKNKYKHKYRYGGRRFFPRPRIHIPAPVVVAPAPVVVAPPVTYVFDQVWIEPVYQQVISGYDSCGNPIYHQQIVTPGYYRTAKYRVFPNGAREFVCYQ